MDAPLENRDLDTHEGGAVSLRALRSALSRVPIWFLTWAVIAFLALSVSSPWYSWYEEAIGHNYAPGAVSPFLDSVFRVDHEPELAEMNRTTAVGGAIAAFVAILAGIFFAGGWLQIILERTRRQRVRRFVFGGSRYFWRFFRVLFLTLLVLAFFGWVIYETPFERYVAGAWLDVPAESRQSLETMQSELSVFSIRGAQDLLMAILFALTMVWGTYTRTRIALQGTHSALWAGIQTFFTMLRHPIRTLRPMVVLLVAEIAIILVVAVLVQWIEGVYFDPETVATVGTGRVLLVGALGQLALMWRAVTRGAGYHVAASVSHDIVRPLSRPDPWKESIGGPGGPRYPLEEGDEYGVAM